MTSFSPSIINELKSGFNSAKKHWLKTKLYAEKAWDTADVVYDEAQVVYNNKQQLIETDESLANLKDALDAVNGLVESNGNSFIFTGLQSLRGLNGINRAFNSKTYPDAASLISKANSLSQRLVEEGEIIGLRAKHAKHIDDFFFKRMKLGKIASDFNLSQVPEIVGVNALSLPNNHFETVSYIEKITTSLLEFFGFVSSVGTDLLKPVALWSTGLTMKFLSLSGASITKYIGAAALKSLPALAPAAGGTLAPIGATAWSTLIPYAGWAVAIALLIGAVIALKYREDEEVTVGGNVIIMFGSGGHEYVAGEFGEETESEFEKFVRSLMAGGGYDTAFALDGEVPVFGISAWVKLDFTLVPPTFNAKLLEHNLQWGNGFLTIA